MTSFLHTFYQDRQASEISFSYFLCMQYVAEYHLCAKICFLLELHYLPPPNLFFFVLVCPVFMYDWIPSNSEDGVYFWSLFFFFRNGGLQGEKASMTFIYWCNERGAFVCILYLRYHVIGLAWLFGMTGWRYFAQLNAAIAINWMNGRKRGIGIHELCLVPLLNGRWEQSWMDGRMDGWKRLLGRKKEACLEKVNMIALRGRGDNLGEDEVNECIYSVNEWKHAVYSNINNEYLEDLWQA